MAIKVEIVTPITSVSETAGSSIAIEVIKSTTSPITTNGSQAVVEVVGKNVVNGVVVSAVPPSNPYDGQVWIDIS